MTTRRPTTDDDDDSATDDDDDTDDDDSTANDDDVTDDDDSTANDDDSATDDDDVQPPVDNDGDGVPLGEDCNDSHSGIYPGAPELCNALDDDCDDVADEDGVCPCPVAWWPDDLHPYMFCVEETTWHVARDACQDHGYELVTFDSQAELDWATTAAVGYATDKPWWIGFADEIVESSWGWVDGSPATWINWCLDEPNNSHGGECVPEVEEEDCGMLNWGEGGCWNDYPCGCSTIYRICEGLSELRPTD